MSVNTINKSSGSHSTFVPQVWSARVFKRLWMESPLLRDVNKDYSREVAQQGDTININFISNLRTYSKLADTAVTKQTPAGAKVPLVLDYHEEVTILIEDILEAQSNKQLLDKYAGKAAEALADKIVSVLAAQYANAASGMVVGTNTTEMDELTILQTRRLMNDMHAPKSGRRMYVKDATPLLKLERFTSFDKVGSAEAMRRGEIDGFIHGFRIQEDIRLIDHATASGAAGAVHNLAMTDDGLLLATRDLALPKAGTGAVGYREAWNGISLRFLLSYDTDFLADKLTVDCVFGVLVPNEVSVTGYKAPFVDVKTSVASYA